MSQDDYQIMKFGGSCLVCADDMERAAEIVSEARNPVVIASAMSGVTQDLIALSEDSRPDKRAEIISRLRKIHLLAVSKIKNPGTRDEAASEIIGTLGELEFLAERALSSGGPSERAELFSYGERLSALILKWYIIGSGKNAVRVNSDEIIRSRDDEYLNATVDEETSGPLISDRVNSHRTRGEIPVITGFFCRSVSGRVALMGRNSSDYTASVVAYAFPRSELVFWKDVPGLMTADPKLVRGTQVIKHLSYEQASRYIINGARILHPMVIELAKRKSTPIKVRDFRAPLSEGTLITSALPSAETS